MPISGHPIHTFDASYSDIEMITLFKITKPKVIFCDLDVVYKVKSTLSKLKDVAFIFTFDGSINGTIDVCDLFRKTGYEEAFEYVLSLKSKFLYTIE